jgi:hypothetical protein
MPDRNGNLLDNVTPVTAPRAAESPFGPVIKRRREQPPQIPAPRRPVDHADDDGPVVPRIPNPRKPSVTPLVLARRTRPPAPTEKELRRLRAQYARLTHDWDQHLKDIGALPRDTAEAEQPDTTITPLQRLADAAHLAVDLDLYRSAA